jgi:hypothetical protein
MPLAASHRQPAESALQRIPVSTIVSITESHY